MFNEFALGVDPGQPAARPGPEHRVLGPQLGVHRPRGVPTGDVCFFTNFSLERLAPGTWRIALQTPEGPLAKCQVALKAGPNWAGFRQGAPTCKLSTGIGFFYP